MKIVLVAACFFLTIGAQAEPTWLSTLPEALSASAARGKPVLMDFQAPWCYSCYYMEKNVLTHAPFLKKTERLVLLKVDVDLPEGRALKEKYRVTFLPTYILADSKGKELSRIIGEQTEKDFLEKLGATEEKAPSPEIAGAREALMRAVNALPPRKGQGMAALKTLLRLDDSCLLAYDIEYAQKFLESATVEEKKAVLASERVPLEKLVDEKVFAGTCADFRTSIEDLADVYEGLGAAQERAALLERAVAALEKKAADVGEDRNRDDNLRYFLELKGDDPAVRGLYARLIEAYASDYVYPYRFARYLSEKGEFVQALPFIEKAEKYCYGANRLSVTKVRAKILAGLGRKEEARSLLERDIKANKKAFAKDVESLSALLKEVSK